MGNNKSKKAIENIELLSDEVHEILTFIPHWMIRWGNGLLFGLIILFLFFSWFIKYPDIIISDATITTKIPPQKVYSKLSAKFDSIYVNDMEIVTKNKVLAVLNNSANSEDVFLIKSIVDSIDFNKNNIQFPIDELPILLLGDVNDSFNLFENSYLEYKMNFELQPFFNESTANERVMTELNRSLNILNAQFQIIQAEIKFKKNEFERYNKLFTKGVISKQEFEYQQLELLKEERSRKTIDLSISKTKEEISTAKKNSKVTEINKEKAELQLSKDVVQNFIQLKKSLKDWENKYVLKSEIEGKVSFLNYWSENQTVTQGDLIFTIIPAFNSAYIAKIRAPALNSGKIKLNQNVIIKLQNYSDVEFGVLRGRVKNISQTQDKDGFYLIDVTLENNLVTSYNKKINFRHEMKGTAEIITEDLRLIERFFYKFKELLSRTNKSI